MSRRDRSSGAHRGHRARCRRISDSDLAAAAGRAPSSARRAAAASPASASDGRDGRRLLRRASACRRASSGRRSESSRLPSQVGVMGSLAVELDLRRRPGRAPLATSAVLGGAVAVMALATLCVLGGPVLAVRTLLLGEPRRPVPVVRRDRRSSRHVGPLAVAGSRRRVVAGPAARRRRRARRDAVPVVLLVAAGPAPADGPSVRPPERVRQAQAVGIEDALRAAVAATDDATGGRRSADPAMGVRRRRRERRYHRRRGPRIAAADVRGRSPTSDA